MEYEATELRPNYYAVRPKGQLGNMRLVSGTLDRARHREVSISLRGDSNDESKIKAQAQKANLTEGAKLMNSKTLAALRGSIAKWEAIVAGTGRDLGISNCPLCRLFYSSLDDAGHRCEGCPVSEKTDQTHCYGSPYEQ